MKEVDEHSNSLKDCYYLCHKGFTPLQLYTASSVEAGGCRKS